MVICLQRGADLHMAQLMPLSCHSLSIALVKSRSVLPLWYRLTRVVPGVERLLCNCSSPSYATGTCSCVVSVTAVIRRRQLASRTPQVVFGPTTPSRPLNCLHHQPAARRRRRRDLQHGVVRVARFMCVLT